MKTETKRTVAAKLMLFSSAVIWGSSFFILKNTLDELPVYFLLCVRFLFSAILLSIVFFKKWKLFNLKYLWTGAITGAFLGFAYIFQTIGLKHTTPGTNAFLTTVYCVIVPFLSWAVSKKRPDVCNFIAAAICITGIGLVCLDTNKVYVKGVKVDTPVVTTTVTTPERVTVHTPETTTTTRK